MAERNQRAGFLGWRSAGRFFQGVAFNLMDFIKSLLEKLTGKKDRDLAKEMKKDMDAESVEMDTTMSEFDDMIGQTQQSIDRMRDSLKADAAMAAEASKPNQPEISSPEDSPESQHHEVPNPENPPEDEKREVAGDYEEGEDNEAGQANSNPPEKSGDLYEQPGDDAPSWEGHLDFIPAGLYQVAESDEGHDDLENPFSLSTWHEQGNNMTERVSANIGSEVAECLNQYQKDGAAGESANKVASIMFEVRLAGIMDIANDSGADFDDDFLNKMAGFAWKSVEYDFGKMLGDVEVEKASRKLKQGDITSFMEICGRSPSFDRITSGSPEDATAWCNEQREIYNKAIENGDLFISDPASDGAEMNQKVPQIEHGADKQAPPAPAEEPDGMESESISAVEDVRADGVDHEQENSEPKQDDPKPETFDQEKKGNGPSFNPDTTEHSPNATRDDPEQGESSDKKEAPPKGRDDFENPYETVGDIPGL